MTRVSENSSQGIIRHSLNKNKQKLEDLQLQGTTLKSLTRPSDSPINNVEALSIKSRLSDNNQYIRNIDYAILNLNATEKSLEQLTEIMVKAKEIAIAQASDFYDNNARESVANEVKQLRNQTLAISNKRIGSKYLFGGFKSLQRPFSDSGEYRGDQGRVNLEVSKDFFVPVNLNGHEIFYSTDNTSLPDPRDTLPKVHKTEDGKNIEIKEEDFIPPASPSRDLASLPQQDNGFKRVHSLFHQLDGLASALDNNDAILVQSLLEKFDDSIARLITLRTRVGSVVNSIESSRATLESDNVDSTTRKSKLEDADITELFSDIMQQQNVLKTSYQASQGLINQTLLDFLK